MGGAEIVEVIDCPAAFLSKLGLNSPVARFACLSTVLAMAAYCTKTPGYSFRNDGSVKPLKITSPEPDAVSPAKHFLTIPVVASFLIVGRFT